ncbi:vitamin K epoxide reductase family protein [Candidatus Woesearchaeota archaeon]|jgi:uncharacterized membrane protein|nr:vitamin K epoxide reductase family protein [Candidatus Woesearchaeota archaeon]
MKKKTTLIILIILAILGVLTSAYLAYLHYTLVDSVCDFNAQFSCTTINRSAYAKIFDIPVSILGVFGYFLLAIIPFLLIKKVNFKKINTFLSNRLISKGYFLLSLAAFIFSLYLTGLELKVIGVICPLCLISQILILFILFFSYNIYKTEVKNEN